MIRVTLTVRRESGFTKLRKGHEAVVKHMQENTEGWEIELIAAKTYVEECGL